MANRAVHDAVGIAAGTLLAVHQADVPDRVQIFWEAAGGCIGGLLGSRMPDFIDPPTSPNHRNFGHGALTAGGAGAALWNWLKEIQSALRTKADELVAERNAQMSDLELLGNQLLEILCRVLAGLIMGLLGGYASHLALDATTPKGLPLICAGL